MTAPRVAVVRLEPPEYLGSVRAVGAVRIDPPGWTVEGWLVCERSRGPYVRPPTMRLASGRGAHTVHLPPDLLAEVEAALIDAYAVWAG
ncbi:hypothetical protein [Pararhodospirillum oryzae]|uniref:Uncharacterized protein n=1 Tax=Pararhodospirillum oryzae TaxID=478448 RepID=A0A512HAW8_9PROT|nr:hypothetical protein [Pararhodospirillum oryzae]GEO82601.1 hypothetical protein ROR02_27320 [Pararhodospirillum oryzae]